MTNKNTFRYKAISFLLSTVQWICITILALNAIRFIVEAVQ